MATRQKLLDKIRQNPHNWRIEQLETIVGLVGHYGINVRRSGGSHVVFDHPSWIELLCIPARRPIKPIYIKKLITLLERLESS